MNDPFYLFDTSDQEAKSNINDTHSARSDESHRDDSIVGDQSIPKLPVAIAEGSPDGENAVECPLTSSTSSPNTRVGPDTVSHGDDIPSMSLVTSDD